jgi:hypothetical protein
MLETIEKEKSEGVKSDEFGRCDLILKELDSENIRDLLAVCSLALSI